MTNPTGVIAVIAIVIVAVIAWKVFRGRKRNHHPLPGR